MRDLLRPKILIALHRADGVPLPESALAQAVRQLVRPARPSSAEIAAALRSLDDEKYLIGSTEPISNETTWTLSTAGQHRALQLASR